MATSGNKADAYSARPNYSLYMTVSREAISGNSTSWDWDLYARQDSGSDSWALDPQDWSAAVEGSSYSGATPMDFRGSVTLIRLGGGITPLKAHDADGYLTLDFSASMTGANVFGSAALSSSFVVDRIPKAPYQPAQPTFVSASASALTFSGAAPADDGGTPIIDYTYQLATDAGFTSIVTTRVSTAGSQTFVGLDPATTYYLRHRGRNSVGDGVWSTARTATTLVAVPSAPQTLSGSGLGPTSATLNWLAPANNGGGTITGYRITRALNAARTLGVTQFTQGATLSRAFTDLLPSTAYYFWVEALNSAGYSPFSASLMLETVSGVYYSNGVAWLPAGVFVSDGAAWEPAEIEVSDGAAWVAAV